MTEREEYFAGRSPQAIRDTKDSPLDPPKAPAISIPAAAGHHEPFDGADDRLEALKVYAVLSLLAIGFVLFVGLMTILHTLNVL
jgi:hypothetical protein